MQHDEVRMRLLWEAGGLKTIEIAEALGTTLDAVRGTARRRGWVRGPVLRGKKPITSERSPIGSIVESPEKAPRRTGKVIKLLLPPPPEPPKPRQDPPWSTIFSRLDEVHHKMDRVLVETRGIPRLEEP